MKKATSVILAAFAALAVSGTASAQSPLSVEVRGGAAIPTGDFADNAKTNVGYGATVGLRVAPMISVYGGYSRAEFGLTQTASDATDAGFEVGARVGIPGLGTGISPWVKAGALFHELELEQRAIGTARGDSEPGFEVGAGLAFPLGPQVTVTPGVAFRRYNTEFFGQGTTQVSYVNADLGLHIRL